ncbi:hypothetical protein ACFVQB_14760 [Paenibacillus sp. NPDC057886]|uniref:hypothetical protein n=1 Tax=Paenibacillus sp. NPDC057886 TaxID=3346270 RepID=UPI0036B478B1
MKNEAYKRKVPSGVINTPAYRIQSRVMVLKGGSDALHLMGNIGREEDDLINVIAEDDSYYIGTFCEGFGFFDVHFLKENVRPMNKEEVEKLNRTYHTISGRVLGKNHYDYDGYWIGNQ